jgi:hypothetical protein
MSGVKSPLLAESEHQLRAPHSKPTVARIDSTAVHAAVLRAPSGIAPAAPEDVDAILRALHAERRSLLAQKSAQGLSEGETEYLTDVEHEIDRLELIEDDARSGDQEAIWSRLERVALRLLEIEAKSSGGG